MTAPKASHPLEGLLAPRKSLPTWLLYDDAGCALYERITTLPEYYLTRAETDVLTRHSNDIVALAADGGVRLSLAEIGAGSATKTELLIAAALERLHACEYLACDIAAAPLAAAATRLRAKYSGVRVATFAGSHLDARPALASLSGRQVLLFLGSSLGNYRDAEAIELLGGMRRALRDDGLLVLGTDLKKDPSVIRAAYDDSAGVTAAFTKNVLVRLNREFACDFRVEHFRHVAEWVEGTSSVDVSLEATRRQTVVLRALDREVLFVEGERVHLETCVKYDGARVDRILREAGFARVCAYLDAEERYAVQIATVLPRHPGGAP
ncbi:MAG: L-histidine N(alpha)-methyltransferase [Sandaracinaceae bacterium]|nr:L-histidine N(alpha)-methyltransferase [Sandaracinaceae bacterium]